MKDRKALRVPGVYGATLNLPLDKGDAGIDQTAAAMAAVIHSAAASAIVQDFTRRMIPQGVSPEGRAVRVYMVLQQVLEYKADPKRVEMLRHPDQLVTEITAAAGNPDPSKRKTGCDCDDVAMLGAAMLLVSGIDAALIVMAPEPGGEFKHVYFAARIPDPTTGELRTLPLDPQETKTPFTQRKAARRKAYPL
jgi:hypothetical protein